jgi:Domain of unknown function (DUF4907)
MKKHLSFLKVGVLLLTCLFISNTIIAQPGQQHPQTNIMYKTIKAPNKTFGYDIYVNNHKMIHQSSIPCIAGNDGFKTRDAAEKVAQLVISKIRQGEMPPTVTIEEMKKLKAIN